jgi:hypothetical protein
MSERLAPRDADLLQRAEKRWLEQANERLRRPARRPHPDMTAPVDAPVDIKETDR